MAGKKIALLLAQPDEPYQQKLMRGVMKKAFSRGYSVTAFSMYIKYQNNRERELGESNVYNLISPDQYDAVILFSDLIQTPGVEEKLEERLHREFKGPVICVDTESRYFRSFWTDGYEVVYAEVSHMIEEHGLTDIAYLTGRRKHVHSQRRLKAFRDAMEAHGLTVDEKRVFYGDFWYTSGTNCAEMLLRDRSNLPEAILCANDCMAIGLAQELEKNGVRIPEDIRLAGYGTSEEGQTSPSSLTSTWIPAEYYGTFAVDAVIRMLEGEEVSDPKPEAELYIGQSCGCHPEERDLSRKRESWVTDDSEEGFESVHNYLAEDLLCAGSIEEFFRTLYESIFYLRGIKKLHICLDPCWLDPEKLLSDALLREGYPEKMVEVLVYDAVDASLCGVSTDRIFDTEKLIPDSADRGPEGLLVTPLFFEDRSFGYVVLSYDRENNEYESVTRQWLQGVMRGLEAFRRELVIRQLEKKGIVKFPANAGASAEDGAMINPLAGLSEEEQREMKEVDRILQENLLIYHFQPIVSAVDGEIYSYEALMRSNTEKKISPLSILHYADLLGRLADVERATFCNVLGILEENRDLFEGRKIFINSIPGCKLQEQDRERIETLLRRNAGTAVVELTEQAELSDEELELLKEKYRDLGVGSAVDDYGTGYSNVSNLLRYMPDYVKIDRSLLSGIQDSTQKQHFVREIVDFCHENNIMALAEGVETREELRTVIRLGADLIQGYYVARPSAEVLASVDGDVRMEIRRYHQEKEDGSSDLTYIAGSTSRVSLNHLIKENKTTIVVGSKDATFRDITIAGTPNSDTKIHIDVLEGYDGRITLENVCLSNKKLRPCINISEGVNLTLCLEGENTLKGGGIKVSEGANLAVEGEGNLKILLTGADSYGIGNAKDQGHGTLEFFQDGEIYIESKGQCTIGIGSGLGGETSINKGKYVIRLSGDDGVGIGSLTGDQPIEIHDCDLLFENSFFKGVHIGNLSGNTDVRMWRSLIRCTGSGKNQTVIGTVDGETARVEANDLSIHMDLTGDKLTGLGSRKGRSEISLSYAGFIFKAIGREAYVYGGISQDTEIEMNSADVSINLTSDSGKLTLAPKEKIHEVYGRSSVVINGRKRS